MKGIVLAAALIISLLSPALATESMVCWTGVADLSDQYKNGFLLCPMEKAKTYPTTIDEVYEKGWRIASSASSGNKVIIFFERRSNNDSTPPPPPSMPKKELKKK